MLKAMQELWKALRDKGVEAHSPILDLSGVRPRITAAGASRKPDNKEGTGCLTTDGAKATRRD